MASEKLELILEEEKKYLIISIVLVLISIFLITINSIINDKLSSINKSASNYNYLISNSLDEEGIYSTVTINFLQSFYQAGNRIYFYAKDEYNNYFITNMSYELYKKIELIYLDNPDSFSYTITGYLFEMPENIKEIAIGELKNIDTYKDDFKEEITLENYNKYFGSTYISEENITPMPKKLFIFIIIIFISLSSIFVIIYIKMLINRFKVLNKYNQKQILKELEEESTIEFDRLKLFISDKHIIFGNKGLNIIPIKSIQTAYIQNNKYNGIHISYELIIYTNDGKKYEIAHSKKYLNDIKMALVELKGKNDDIRV